MFSVRTEDGLRKLNDLLAKQSYLAGSEPTTDDLARVGELRVVPGTDFPHARRWYQHITFLKTAYPHKEWTSTNGSGAAAPKGGAAAAGGAGGEKKGKGKDQAQLEGVLKNAEMGKVCTRFPPEPSGFLHIGHAKAAMLNHHYARAFNGKFIVRFDDTNPSKEKAEFEESIIADLKTLGITADKVSHTSDYFEKLQELMEKVIKDGKAYCDDTEMLKMREERDKGTESARRNSSVEENMKHWKEMLAGTPEGQKFCVRGKMNMTDKVKCNRDPVFFRCKVDVPHHQTGTKYKAYPTYDFACAVVDSIEGVTHPLRTIEYKDRDEMYQWVLAATGFPKKEITEFSKTQFQYTILSKRKLQLLVDNKVVSGWDDPRMPTVQGIMNRGMTVDGLLEFVMTQGASKATNLMAWDKIWAINKQKIDPIVPRYAAIEKDEAVKLVLSDGPEAPYGSMIDCHQKNADLGKRLQVYSKEVYLRKSDLALVSDGEEVTLLHWGNAFIKKVNKGKGGEITGASGSLNPGGDVKTTKWKLHWVPAVPNVTNCIIREYDHVMSKEKLEDDEEIMNFINKNSVREFPSLGDPMLKTLQKGAQVQLERRGYFRVLQVAFRDEPLVLVETPDGRAKSLTGETKIEGGKVTEKAKNKAEEKKAAPPEKGAPKEKGAKPKEAAKGGKPSDRPLDDVSRLDIRVGKIVNVWPHPEADKLWCEEIDLGEGSVRTIASGLREFVPESEMRGARVVVLCNLKPRNMKGFQSQGMVLCAATDEKVELLTPPEGVPIGERITVEGYDGEADEKLNEKEGKAPLPKILPDLKTDGTPVACFKGTPLMTSKGPLKATLKNVAVR